MAEQVVLDSFEELAVAIRKIKNKLKKLKIDVAALKLVVPSTGCKSRHRSDDEEVNDEDMEESHPEEQEEEVEEGQEEDAADPVRSFPYSRKAYTCKRCGKGFGYPHTLARHLRSSCKATGSGLVTGNGLATGNGLVSPLGLYRDQRLGIGGGK